MSRTSELKYRGAIDLEVANNSHTIAFKLIRQEGGANVRRVLEVGCASGYFGETLRDHGYTVWGIEQDAAAAELARTRLDQVFEGPVEAFLDSRGAGDLRFDCIVFGDVLEHLADPASVLRRCRSILAPGGMVVASIPNVAHVAVRAMLLEGRWDYSELGIMDRTHLRFFARSTLVELFSAAGLGLKRLEYVELPAALTGIPCAEETGKAIVPLCRDDTALAFQYVVAARPADDAQAANRPYLLDGNFRVLCALPLPNSSLAAVRLRAPLTAWRSRHGGQFRPVSLFDVTAQDLEWADVVVVQRLADESVHELVESIQSRGIPVIFDIDDFLLDVPPFLASAEYCRRNRGHLQAILKCADVVTVSTDRLRQSLSPYSRNLFVIPNCAENHRPPIEHGDGDAVSLLVASSDSVRVDFLVPALKRICSEFGDRVRVVAIGPPGEALQAAGVPVARIGMLPYEDFQRFISAQHNSIGLIPLDDSHFSSCKSAIKYIDYALAGIPVVCSDVPPYADVIEHGASGLLAANEEDATVAALRELIGSAALRRRLAGEARRLSQERFSMDVAARAWQKALDDAALNGIMAPFSASGHRALPRARTVRGVMKRVLRPSSYLTSVKILRSEGLGGLRRRLRGLR